MPPYSGFRRPFRNPAAICHRLDWRWLCERYQRRLFFPPLLNADGGIPPGGEDPTGLAGPAAQHVDAGSGRPVPMLLIQARVGIKRVAGQVPALAAMRISPVLATMGDGARALKGVALGFEAAAAPAVQPPGAVPAK